MVITSVRRVAYVVIGILAAVSLAVAVIMFAQSRCIDSGQGNCGNALFERLDEIGSNPTEAGAEEAVRILSAVVMSTSSNTLLAERTDAAIDGAVDVTVDSSAPCLIAEIRKYARTNLDIQISTQLLESIDMLSKLDRPMLAIVEGQLGLPGPADLVNTALAAEYPGWLERATATAVICTS